MWTHARTGAWSFGSSSVLQSPGAFSTAGARTCEDADEKMEDMPRVPSDLHIENDKHVLLVLVEPPF